MMAAFGNMPPLRAPLSRAIELDSRTRERSVTASEDGHYPERDDASGSSRAGSVRAGSMAQEEQARSSEEEESQRGSSPRHEKEQEE